MATDMRDTRNGRAPRHRDHGDRKSRKGLWILLAILAVIAAVAIAFFALGGDADVDGEVDVEAPNVDVQEGDDANVDAESEEGGG